MREDYVHGYSDEEAGRLADQANTLSNLLHEGTQYPAGSKVLEAGCGVGAQTVILAKNSPDAEITSIDISELSIEQAKKLIDKNRIKNVNFAQSDLHDLPFEDKSFDHIFICFVLEHLQDPLDALNSIRRFLKDGGSITVIEGDHGSCYFHPETKEAVKVWECLIECQKRFGCNPMIGREVYPLMIDSGFKEVQVVPKVVYVDSGKPDLVDGFNKKTIIAMVEGVKEQALDLNMIDIESWEKGINDLFKTTEINGVFFYNFFKGTGIK